jgi:probable F420-dependent oxidoreductase
MERSDHWPIGLLVMHEDLATSIAIVRAAEAANLDSAWTIEFYNRDSFVRLAAFAAHTSRIRLGSHVTVAFVRPPLMTATAAADVQELAGGRLILGLGTSTKRMNEDWYGLPFDHPAPRLTELVRLLRALWAHRSGPFSYAGRFYRVQLGHYQRQRAVEVDPPIYTAGVNPRMVRVAGEVADGFAGHTIATVPYLRQVALPAIQDGARRAGRTLDTFALTSQVITAISDDPAVARREAALQAAYYSTVRSYDVILDLHGFQEEAQRIRAAFRQGDTEGMVAAVGDRMLAEMAIFGTPHQVRDQLERYRGIVDVPVLYSPHYGVSPARLEENHYAIIKTFGSGA